MFSSQREAEKPHLEDRYQFSLLICVYSSRMFANFYMFFQLLRNEKCEEENAERVASEGEHSERKRLDIPIVDSR